MDFDKRLILPLVLVATGITIVIISAYLALKEFISYRTIDSSSSSIEQSISTTVNTIVNLAVRIVNLAVRIAFIAAAIWSGSILIKYGTKSYIDFNKPPKIVKVYVRSRKRTSD